MSEVQKQKPHQLLCTFWFDEKSIPMLDTYKIVWRGLLQTCNFTSIPDSLHDDDQKFCQVIWSKCLWLFLMTINANHISWRGFCFGNNFKNENGLIDQTWVWASIHEMSGGYADPPVGRYILTKKVKFLKISKWLLHSYKK